MAEPFIDPADPLGTDEILRRHGLLETAETFRRETAQREPALSETYRPLFHPDVPTPPVSATADELAAALEQTGFRHTDPVADPRHPGIAAVDPLEDGTPDQFPDSWGVSGATERDQAALDAAWGPE